MYLPITSIRKPFSASKLIHWYERRQCLYICLTSLQIVDYETRLLSSNLISGIRRALSSIKCWVTINVRWVLNYGLQLSNTHPKGSASALGKHLTVYYGADASELNIWLKCQVVSEKMGPILMWCSDFVRHMLANCPLPEQCGLKAFH